MVHKLGNRDDVEKLSGLSPAVRKYLYEITGILTDEYGADRDIDDDDGGYVLYAEKGTSKEDIKKIFDYSEYDAEYVSYVKNTQKEVCSVLYILNNEFVVTIVMMTADAPKELLEEIK